MTNLNLDSTPVWDFSRALVPRMNKLQKLRKEKPWIEQQQMNYQLTLNRYINQLIQKEEPWTVREWIWVKYKKFTLASLILRNTMKVQVP